MPRSVNSVSSKNRRKKILKQAKGYWGRRKNVFTIAKNAVEKALQYAYTHQDGPDDKFFLPNATGSVAKVIHVVGCIPPLFPFERFLSSSEP